MSRSPDRLYDLLPAVYRERDAARGWPLRALLQVIAEQVDVIEDDVEQLYDDWFIETCRDWVVPYIGELVGYRPVLDPGEPADPRNERDRTRSRIIIPRRDVAKTIANRRRKGTLSLLEDVARDVSGWPARAVELGRPPALVPPPEDPLATTADLMALVAGGASPDVALFVWRLQAYSVSGTSAYCIDPRGGSAFTFSALGNDVQLFAAPPAPDPLTGLRARGPMPISRAILAANKGRYVGPSKDIEIWTGPPGQREPIDPSTIEIVDLTTWSRPPYGKVALDPELGRLAFPTRHAPKGDISVSYRYGGVMDLGGGEYARPVPERADAATYRVGSTEPFERIEDALETWSQEQPTHAIIEIAESEVFTEPLHVLLPDDASLQIRAAAGTRPIIRLLNVRHPSVDALFVEAGARSELVLDGLLIAGRGIRIDGACSRLTIRHCTLVPGWDVAEDSPGGRYTEPSFDFRTTTPRVHVDRSIIGPIVVNVDEVDSDPLALCIADSIVDATAAARFAISGPADDPALVSLGIARSTVLGQMNLHAIDLAESSIFTGTVTVARRQVGCVRFCYVPNGSSTPRRFHCEPETSAADPKLASTQYGTVGYARLTADCPEGIREGADDRSEMGVYHDLYVPQRDANLRARLDENMPVGMRAMAVYVT